MAKKQDTSNAEKSKPIVLPSRDIPIAWKDFRLILIGSVILLLILALSRWLIFLQPLRLALGLAYILFVPGYCMSAALFPRHDDLDGIERIGTSLGLSIAWIPVLALILNILPWGLRLWPVLVGELITITLFGGLAFIRRRWMLPDEAFAPELAWQPRLWWHSLSLADRRLYQFIAIALIGISFTLAWAFLVPTPDQFMTEFYMLGPEGLAENFPREARVGEEIGVTLNLVNLERGIHTYNIEIWAVDPWTQGRRHLLWKGGPYDLSKGDKHELPVTWQMPWPGKDQVVDLLLFDGGGAEPYRRLRLFLDVTQ